MGRKLYIGLGGLGMRVVSMMKKIQDNTQNKGTFYVVLDTDTNDALYHLKDETITFVNMRLNKSVKYYFELLKPVRNVEEWYPTSPTLICSLEEHINMTRAAGRLAFLYAMESGELKPVRELVNKLIMSNELDDCLQIVIVTSLAGGTGSGSFIQLALWIRSQLEGIGSTNYKLDGLFVGPEVFINSFLDLKYCAIDSAVLRGNTYAALVEMELLNRISHEKTSTLSLDKKLVDRLLDCPLPQTGLIFDETYIYDNCNSADGSFYEHIEHLVEMLTDDYPSVVIENTKQVQVYVNDSPRLKEAYLHICERARDRSMIEFTPHTDLLSNIDILKMSLLNDEF